MSTLKFLQVTDCVKGTNDSGRDYYLTTFESVEMVGNAFYANSRKRATSIGNNQYAVGQIVLGEIREFATTPYTIEGRIVKSTTVVVFGAEIPLTVANAKLKSNKACVVNVDGTPTAPENLVEANDPASPINIKD